MGSESDELHPRGGKDNPHSNHEEEEDRVGDLQDAHELYSVLMRLTEGRIRDLLGTVIKPGRATLHQLQGALERWEEQIRKYIHSKEPHRTEHNPT